MNKEVTLSSSYSLTYSAITFFFSLAMATHEEVPPTLEGSPRYSPRNPASLDEPLTLKKTSQPIKKRCSKAHSTKKVFLGPLIWESPNLERAYNFSLKQKMFYEEKVMFNSINCPLLEILLSHNGLANYLGEIDQVKIYPSELGQFYVNMSYQKENYPWISTIVNGSHLNISSTHLNLHAQLPSQGVKLHMFTKLDDLPFECTFEQISRVLTHQYNPMSQKKINASDLTPEASIMLRILHKNIQPNASHGCEPLNIVLVAIYCIMMKIQVDWASLVVHNIACCSTNLGGYRYFPRLISKLIGEGCFDLPLSESSLIACPQPFTCSSFRKKWLNQYTPSNEDASYLLVKENELLKKRMVLLEHQVKLNERVMENMQCQVNIERDSLMDTQEKLQDLVASQPRASYHLQG